MFVRISCTDLWCPLVTLSHRPNKTPGGGVGGGGSSYAQRKLSSLARRAAQQQQQQQPPQHQGELQFTLVMSMLTEFAKINDEDLSMKWFVESAKRYQLTGRPMEELCEHNATVALNLKRHQVAQSWNIIKLLFSATPSTPVSGSKGISTLPSKQDTYKDTDADRGRASSEGKHLTHDARHTDTADSRDTTVADTSTGVSDEESDAQDLELVQRSGTLTYIASGMGTSNHSDFFFGDGDMDQIVYECEPFTGIQNCQDWNLPPESFQPRYDIDDTSTAPDHVTAPTVTPTCGDSPSSANESELGVSSHHVSTVAMESNIRQEILSTRPFMTQVPVWPYTQLVVDMLYYYAEQGDVQMTASVLIVLGEKLRPLVDETLQQLWLMSYIDMLGRFQLWCVANEVIKLSNHNVVTQLNQQSTTIHTNCSKCSKPQLRAGWACERCQSVINTCSICHHPVKGLYVWCQGCCHGGHLEHIREWLRRYKHCPAGCGHYCEYT
ncbi:hypothetical protein NP493_1217g00023 [Ridgeia piscesae]|uniref:WD repeat-containing protein 24 n=1 Tax=Ridgeia piscesae TaxID=27915 RepID=A0AAD9NIP3_RIDPI|nr:hypothetical protein NP493_1217g00023 [Ridgeia piscesae]